MALHWGSDITTWGEYQPAKMIRYKTKTKEEFCQSRYYKDWNPDSMADYNRYCDQNWNFSSGRGQMSDCKWNAISAPKLSITSDSNYLICKKQSSDLEEATALVRLSVVQKFSDGTFYILYLVVLQVRCFYPNHFNSLSIKLHFYKSPIHSELVKWYSFQFEWQTSEILL